MKRFTLRLFLFHLCLIPLFLFSQTISTTTYWLGNLSTNGMNLPLSLIINKLPNDSIKAEMKSLLQSNKPIPVNYIKYKGDSLFFKVSSLNMNFEGLHNHKDSVINGIFKQGNIETVLVFKQKQEEYVLKRPQEPSPPYPYTEKEVSFKNTKNDIVLKGTLTVPNTTEVLPAVILITGSGTQNRDEEILGHKPFKVIADYLSSNGIAVLRFDDRGWNNPEKAINSTTLDFATDVEAAFDFLRKQKEINAKNIGLIGHSEGGAIAAIVAANNKKVSYIISLAGAGVGGAEILLSQNEKIFQLQNVDNNLINIRLKILQEVFEIINHKDFSTIASNIIEENTKELTDKEKQQIGFALKDRILFVSQLQQPWMKTFITLDPKTYFEKVKQPVLAMKGEKDSQVLCDLNLNAIEKALIQGKNDKYKISRFKNLNHLFQNCETGDVSEYGMIEETFSTEALQAILSFIIEKSSKTK